MVILMLSIPKRIKLYLSSDAENWTEIAYNLENVDATPAWKWASADITLKNTVSRLSLKIEYPSGATGTRVDDVRIFVGTGGTEIDLGGGAATPAVTTANASNVAETTVTLGGSIANADLADYSAVGVEYVVFATGNTPDWTGSVKVPAATKAATWTVDVTGLTKETQYAFRAYATPNTGDILYGDHKTFITTGGGSVTAITIPELLQIAKGSVISESQDKVLTAVVCGDPTGNNFSFGTLYVMTEGATEGGNGIVIYNNKSADFNVADYALGDRLKITLQANVAMMDEYNGVKQITGVTTYHVEKSGTATVTPINVAPADLASFVSMPATVQQASTAKAGVWCTASSSGNHTFTSGGTNFTVNVNKRATVFQDIPYAAATGNITGIVTMYGGKGQIAPRNLNDVEAFKVTVPTITEVTPSSLVWTANDTSEKTVTIEGVNFNGFTLSSLTSFNASVEGTTVKISPKAVNTSDAELKETLTITANGGNTATVTLTQNGASSGTKLTITITPTTADSGFPATAPSTEATVTIDGYVWGLLNAKQNAGYLMINGTNGYLATPAVPGSTLKTIKITTCNGISASAKVTIKDTSNNIASPEQAVGDKNTEYTFNLTNPAAGVSYRINSSNKNTQLVKVELSYE